MILHLRRMNQYEDSSLTFKDHLAGNGIHPLKHLFYLSYRHTCLSLNNTIRSWRKMLSLLHRSQKEKQERNKTGRGIKLRLEREYVE